jgi:tetratricopeptide (TPR) repeat protein
MHEVRSRRRRRIRQRAKGPVDPSLGARVRELRLSRGLTQADLAAGDFTKGFISLLETGRTRASLRAAGILATRLGVATGDLLASSDGKSPDLELQLLQGEQMLAAGQGKEALVLLEQLASKGSGALRARALRAHGRGLVDAGRAREGLQRLETASAEFAALGMHEQAIRVLYDRALAHTHLDEPGNALAVALECEASMQARGLPDRTLEFQLRSLLATIFARAGDLESADLQGQRALGLAEDVVDAEALGTLYSTLAGTRQRQGEMESALAYARKGLEVFEGLGRDRAVGQLWYNLATIYLEKREFNKAADAIDRADRVAAASRIPRLQARLLGVRGELAAARGNWRQARELADASATHPDASPLTRGRALVLEARAAAKLKAPARQVHGLIERALKSLAAEPGRIRAEAHDAYAKILAERRQWREAYAHIQSAYDLSRPTLQGETRRGSK